MLLYLCRYSYSYLLRWNSYLYIQNMADLKAGKLGQSLAAFPGTNCPSCFSDSVFKSIFILISLIVLFLLLWQNTVTKATCERKHLIWSSWFQRVRVRHGGGHGSKGRYWSSSWELLFLFTNRQRELAGNGWTLETSKPIISEALLQQGHAS